MPYPIPPRAVVIDLAHSYYEVSFGASYYAEWSSLLDALEQADAVAKEVEAEVYVTVSAFDYALARL